MEILIGVLAFIGAICILFTVIITVMLWFNLFPVEPEATLSYNDLFKENESLKEQLSKFQARELARKLEDVETIDRMFADLEREELIYMNTM